VNSLPKTVTRQWCGCDLNPGPSVPESSTLATRLLCHPNVVCINDMLTRLQIACVEADVMVLVCVCGFGSEEKSVTLST